VTAKFPIKSLISSAPLEPAHIPISQTRSHLLRALRHHVDLPIGRFASATKIRRVQALPSILFRSASESEIPLHLDVIARRLSPLPILFVPRTEARARH